MSAKRILIINGPNLNLLGKRDPETYGSKSFEEYLVELNTVFPELEITYLQSNLEGEIVSWIQDADQDGVILNAGGYSHTSVAIRDAISAVETPVVEVHISNISARESFRHESLLSPVCIGCIFGFGMQSYKIAIQALLD